MNNNLQKEYFTIIEIDSDSYPMVKMRFNESDRLLTLRTETLEKYETFEMYFPKYASVKSKMGDYHYNMQLFFSSKVVDVLKSLNIYNIDYLDAELMDRRGNTNSDYHILHVKNRIECLDKEKSVWDPASSDPNVVMHLDKIVLNEKVLLDIPLEKRLLFKLQEHRNTTLFHESVVDAILAIKPTNIRFVDVETWDADMDWELD